jgi:hypothetical protein
MLRGAGKRVLDPEGIRWAVEGSVPGHERWGGKDAGEGERQEAAANANAKGSTNTSKTAPGAAGRIQAMGPPSGQDPIRHVEEVCCESLKINGPQRVADNQDRCPRR